MKREWFEPGPDGESPFVRKYNASPGTAGEAVAAAFRALLAGEAEVADPPALRVGDVVRLDDPAQMCCEQFIGVQATITGFREDGNPYYTSSRGDSWWPLSACTLVRRAGEAAPVAKDAEIARLTAQRDELRTQLEASELRAKLLEKSYDEQHAAMSEKEGRCMELQAERDTLRARIDAGRVMYGGMYGHEHDIEMWTFNHVDTDTMTALLIDARPIDQPDAAMVDERTGKADRREKNLFGVHGRPGKSDRRRVAGTRADRGAS